MARTRRKAAKKGAFHGHTPLQRRRFYQDSVRRVRAFAYDLPGQPTTVASQIWTACRGAVTSGIVPVASAFMADQGFPLAQCYLGLAYGHGQGVSQDFVQSFMWFDVAQIEEAQKLARDWKPTGKPPGLLRSNNLSGASAAKAAVHT